jgi:hypothetical protein
MDTKVDLSLGLNLTIGSVPLALSAKLDTGPDASIYTFGGCVQNAEIDLGAFIANVGSQFAVKVELPPELNLSARIDYIAGQLTYTKPAQGDPDTEVGVAAKFDLTVGKTTVGFRFYADVIKSSSTSVENFYVVGAGITTKLDFSDLPLVGRIPGFTDLTLTDVGFSYTNADPAKNKDKAIEFNLPQVAKSDNPLYTRSDPNAKDASNYSISASGPQRKFALNNGGFSLTVGLINKATGETMNNFALPLTLPKADPPPYPALSPYAPGKTTPAKSPIHWIEINKQFGPVDLKQIGLNYAAGEATFGLTAGFAVGGFGLDLEGLTITFPLPLPDMPARKTLSFGLDGLGLSITRGSFSLSGAFLRVIDDGITNYYGQVAVKVGNFGLLALGGYSPAAEGRDASVFLYAAVKIPLGGPPFLFITGFAGGFGVNRSLILPSMDKLSGYILLPGNAPSPAGSPSDTISKIMPQFKEYIPYHAGQYWVAAGISFTSFEMIQAFALVTVSFGVDFQIALFGQCSMTFPTAVAGPALAFIQIDILASFTPSSGLLAFEGRLSPASYIFGGFMQLSGGFAFYIWFGGTQGGDDHKGEFVVSIGGYHPAFDKTRYSYYPVVPRLGIAASLGPLQIKGQCYMALTPAMIMAGISMTATWSLGPIKAWFAAGLDFLIAWAPFHYEATAYITVGCSVNLGLFTLSIQVGAGLAIWGPEFGGSALVDLGILSFTISFGAPPAKPKPIDWTTFHKAFLPPNTAPAPKAAKRHIAAVAEETEVVNIIKATLADGSCGGYGPDKRNWLVDPDKFRIETASTIPANFAEWTTETGTDKLLNEIANWQGLDSDGLYRTLPVETISKDKEVWNPAVDIQPMALAGVQSTQTIKLKNVATGKLETGLTITPMLSNSAAALYVIPKDDKGANAEPFAPFSLTGFAISPIIQHTGKVSKVDLNDLLFSQGSSTGFRYQQALPNGEYTVKSEIIDTKTSTTLTIEIGRGHTQKLTNTDLELSALVDEWVASQRDFLLTDLAAAFGTYPPGEVKLTLMAEKALTNWPAVELLGANQ